MAEPTFSCIRRECIKSDIDAYHAETHVCFVCGEQFDVPPEMRLRQCPECLWYKCPACDGCQCSLDEEDQQWMTRVFEEFCHDVEKMADIDVGGLPDTNNSNVKLGLGLQFYFCKRWANLKLGRYEETDLGDSIMTLARIS